MIFKPGLPSGSTFPWPLLFPVTVQPFFPAVKMVKGADGEYGEHAGRTARCTAPTFVGGILEPDLMSVSNDQGWSVFAAALSTSGFDLILSPPTQCQVRIHRE